MAPDQDTDKKAVEALKKACDDAYATYSCDCSHAVWYILKQLADKDTQWLEANQLMHTLSTNSSAWKEVSVDEGWALAQKGIVVVGGLQAKGHGHVIVIYPGEKIDSGGYLYTYTDKKTNTQKTDTLRSHGKYPRALSGSLGSWPGAKSKGDKTVWDPWADDDKFANVTFWTKS